MATNQSLSDASPGGSRSRPWGSFPRAFWVEISPATLKELWSVANARSDKDRRFIKDKHKLGYPGVSMDFSGLKAEWAVCQVFDVPLDLRTWRNRVGEGWNLKLPQTGRTVDVRYNHDLETPKCYLWRDPADITADLIIHTGGSCTKKRKGQCPHCVTPKLHKPHYVKVVGWCAAKEFRELAKQHHMGSWYLPAGFFHDLAELLQEEGLDGPQAPISRGPERRRVDKAESLAQGEMPVGESRGDGGGMQRLAPRIRETSAGPGEVRLHVDTQGDDLQEGTGASRRPEARGHARKGAPAFRDDESRARRIAALIGMFEVYGQGVSASDQRIAAYLDCFGAVDPSRLERAIKQAVRLDKSGYPPSPGQIIEQGRKLDTREVYTPRGYVEVKAIPRRGDETVSLDTYQPRKALTVGSQEAEDGSEDVEADLEGL